MNTDFLNGICNLFFGQIVLTLVYKNAIILVFTDIMLTIDMKSFFLAYALGNIRVLVHGLVGRLRENLVDVIFFLLKFKKHEKESHFL